MDRADALEALRAIPAGWAQPPTQFVGHLSRTDRRSGEVTRLEYMGHADVTLALIEIDPGFEYGWLVHDDGTALIITQDKRLVLYGWLRVLGVRRDGVGTCRVEAAEPEKELIGDLLRNCAMRFGIATALWSKAERHRAEPELGDPLDAPLTKGQAKQLVLRYFADDKELAATAWHQIEEEVAAPYTERELADILENM